MANPTAVEIREKFLSYFEKKHGHTRVESSSLVPHNDPTLLFTNAGMVQFKDCFLGLEKRPYTRATTSQKCVRAGGKHNDLENVGFTARHHTFFEMLGNFSFGDYFKKDAIHYAWDFVTREVGLSKNFLYVSVYKDDDEAADIWHNQEGVARDRISRFGEKDNFWSMGETGPCGPCTEIFIDRGKQYGCGKPDCKVGCDCDRFMEFWNLVFMQFNRDASGKMSPLPRPSVDTGMGLERLCTILQAVDSNYETDLFQDIIQRTAKLAHKPYNRNDPSSVSYRVVADHARATAFLIGDGVLPSNEGRGYVLRRIMRRAIRHGRNLGFRDPMFSQVTGYVIDQMIGAYPDLKDKREFISKATLAEEEQFLRTLERGLTLLDEELHSKNNLKVLSGEIAFKLYDTYGFPLDLTRVICTEKGINVDEVGFEKCMDHQRSESRKHWKGSGDESVEKIYHEVSETLRSKSLSIEFVGYQTLMTQQSQCLKVLPAGKDGLVEALFLKTPFYGESGGQTGDRGWITGPEGLEAEVQDTQKPLPDLVVHRLRILKGKIKEGERYNLKVEPKTRSHTARNHTATHLLQWALREVLGPHVKQAGSLVNAELLRFDFSHFQAMSDAEITKVENLINEKIWAGDLVHKQVMKKDDAVKAGAIAFFGEKYGDEVRVVAVGDYSTELCGGTHVDRSSDIALFKIANESGIAAGVRRIVAYTSEGAYNYLRGVDQKLKGLREKLKASSVDEIEIKLDRLIAAEKEARKQMDRLMSANAGQEVDSLLNTGKHLNGAVAFLSVCQPDASGVKKMRELSDQIQQKAPNAVLVLGMKDPENNKAFLLAAVGPKASPKLKANEIIQELAPLIQGRGGGKADLAQAGGAHLSGVDEAIARALPFLQGKLR